MKKRVFVLLMVLVFSLVFGCKPTTETEGQPENEIKKEKKANDADAKPLAGVANVRKGGGNNNNPLPKAGDNEEDEKPVFVTTGPVKIPNYWTVNSKVRLPIIDFSKIKTINAGAISKEEKERDKAANKLYQELKNQIKAGKDPVDIRNKLEKEYHNCGPSVQAAIAYADYKAKKNRDAGVKAYEWVLIKWPNSHHKWTAVYRIQNLLNKRLYIYSNGSYHNLNSEKIAFQLSGRNIKQVKVDVYQIDLVKMIKEGMNPQAPGIPQHAKLVKTWNHKVRSRGRWWFYDTLRMPHLPSGYFILSVSYKYMTINTLFSTSRLSMISKSDDKTLLCWAKDCKSKKDVGVSDVYVLKAGTVVYKGKSNDSGLFAARMKVRKNDSSSIIVVMANKLGQAVSGSYYYWYNSAQRRVGYAYTDRPVYRPGQKVHFKGFFRLAHGEKLAAEKFAKNGGLINVRIQDSRWKKIYTKNIKINAFGGADGTFTIPKTAKLGNYYLYFSGCGYYCNANFSVEEYKKPEYEVSVVPTKGNILQGEDFEVTASAKYYFGEPVKKATIEYKVYEQTYYHSINYGNSGYNWSWFSGGGGIRPFIGKRRYYRYRPYYNPGVLVKQGKGAFDKDGKFKIKLKSKVNKNNDYKYRVEVSVIDKSRRKISSSGSVIATRSAFTLGVKTDRWCYRPGEKVLVTVYCQDFIGNGVVANVDLSITKRISKGHKKLYTEKIKTDVTGQGNHTFVPDENGHFTFNVSAKDSRGKVITGSYSCWVGDSNWVSPVSYAGLNLKLEKTSCLPGKKIRGIFTTGYKTMALFTLENHQIQAYRLVKLKGGAYPVEEKIHHRCEPAINFNVSMIEAGRVLTQSQRVIVPPLKSFLNIAVARKKEYKPGEKAEYTLKVTNWKNEPVQAELSFGLVDEAIYAIKAERTADIRKVFHFRYRGNTRTSNSFQFYSKGYGGKQPAAPKVAADSVKSEVAMAPRKRGLMKESKKRMKAGRFGGKNQNQLKAPRMRSEFADSGVWKASVRTDRYGIAKIAFTMPDNLTTWRATIRGLSVKGKAGQKIDKVVARKNLMARLQCPRTFTEKDIVTVSGVVHNYLKNKKTAVCRLKVTGGKLLSTYEQKVVLIPGEDKRVDWKIKVHHIDKVTLELYALTDEESDAMRLKIPVVPHGIQTRKSKSGMTSEKLTFSLTLPKSSSPERAKMTISVKPTLAGSVLESLEYLAGYPYGCVEQTMSRFLPSVIVAQTLQNIGMRHKKLETNLPKYVAKGTKRLYDFQHSDGGWGWWKTDKTNPYMTAYVIYGLSMANQADYAIKQNVINRGISALNTMIPREKTLESKTYMVFAYGQYKKPSSVWLNDLYAKVDKMNSYCKAIFVVTLKKYKDRRYKKVFEKLLNDADDSSSLCSFSGKTLRYGWTDNPIETTAYCLKAIVTVDPEHKLIPKILRWLELKKQGRRYSSTKDTAAVVFAFSEYLRYSKELNPNYDANIIVNGKEQGFAFKGTKANVAQKTFTFKPIRGKNTITISKNGKGKVYYSAYIDYYSNEEGIKASNNGIIVKREYFKLLSRKDKNGRIVFDRKPLGNKIKQGEVFEVVLTLSGAKDYQYVMLEDFIPAGCEFEKEDTKRRHYYYRYYYYGYANKEKRDDRLVVFFTYYSKGSRKISYKLRAETPGEYHAMPARAEMMYFPAVSGHSSEKMLHILDD